MIDKKKLLDTFSDIISGTGVTRSKHELILDGQPVVDDFIHALVRNGFQQTIVGKVEVDIGERVPAFFIDNTVAYFGWVFWEKYTNDKARKLWGSVVRNRKGDWAIQIPPTKPTPIYANTDLRIEMDADKPVSL